MLNQGARDRLARQQAEQQARTAPAPYKPGYKRDYYDTMLRNKKTETPVSALDMSAPIGEANDLMSNLRERQASALKPLQDRIAGLAPLEATQQANRAREAQSSELSSFLASQRGKWDPNVARAVEIKQAEAPTSGLIEQQMAEQQEIEKSAQTIAEVSAQYQQQEQGVRNTLQQLNSVLSEYENQKLALTQKYQQMGQSAEQAERAALLALADMGLTDRLSLVQQNLNRQISESKQWLAIGTGGLSLLVQGVKSAFGGK